MSRIISIANQKGGVAKTTTAFNLGTALAQLGYKVLLVDLDPQGSLTACCRLDTETLDRTIYDAMMKNVDAADVMVETGVGVDLLPANIDLSLAEVELVNAVARERRLASVLVPVRDDFDFILIDCHPSLGLLTINALAVSDEVIIPFACEYLALRGVRVLLKIIGKIRLQLNSKLRITGLLPTMFDGRTRHSRQILEELRQNLPARVPIFENVISRSIRFAEAAQAGEPVFSYAPTAPGAQAYLQLAQEVVNLKG